MMVVQICRQATVIGYVKNIRNYRPNKIDKAERHNWYTLYAPHSITSNTINLKFFS
jgi:hypothetical protein